MPQFKVTPLFARAGVPCDTCGDRATHFVVGVEDRRFRSFRCDKHDPSTGTPRESELVDCADDSGPYETAQVA